MRAAASLQLVAGACILSLATVASIPAWGAQSHRQETAGRPYTAGDGVILREFGPPHAPLTTLVSPDGRHFAVRFTHFDLQEDRRASTVLVYSFDEVRSAIHEGRAARPRGEFSLAAGAPESPVGAYSLSELRWLPDSNGLIAISARRGENVNAFALNLDTGQTLRLTHFNDSASDAPGVGFIYSYRAGVGLYKAVALIIDRPNYNYPIEFAPLHGGDVSTRYLANIKFLSELRFAWADGRMSEPLSDLGGIAATDVIEAVISPDASYVVVLGAGRFVLLRLDRAGATAPVATWPAIAGSTIASRIFWTADSRQIVLQGVQPEAGKDPVNVAAYNIIGGSWHTFDSDLGGVPAQIDWSEIDNRLIVEAGPGTEPTAFVYRDEGWSNFAVSELPAPPGRDLEVTLRQSENDPPILVATDEGRTITLVGEDPTLTGVHLAQQRQFLWRDPDGSAQMGGLVLPHDYRPGTRVPVVIQPYYYYPDIFLPNGPSHGAYAAQALAARGIGVIQIGVRDLMPSGVTAPREGWDAELPRFVGRIDALVDALVEQGVADGGRIALSGFSRGGFLSHGAITHPARTRFAAASVADSVVQNFASFVRRMIGHSSNRTPMVRMQYNSGRSFWEEPAFWLERDLIFNADRVATPALFSYHIAHEFAHLAEPDAAIDTIGAFAANGNPLEMIYLGNASHQPSYPLQRAAVMSTAIDWMAFWLLDEEDPSPAKVEQYRRWRELRRSWTSVRADDPGRPQDGFIRARSGLHYRIDNRVTGTPPADGQELTIHYIARRGDGTEIANSRSSGRPLVVRLPALDTWSGNIMAERSTSPVNGLGRGWDQILRLMHVGERATLYMPADVAVMPGGPQLPSGETLRFDIELTSAR